MNAARSQSRVLTLQGGKVYLQLYDQSGSTFRQTFGRHNVGQVFFREFDNLVTRGAWLIAFGRSPTPRYKCPPMVRDRRVIRSLRRFAFHDGEKDLLIAREMEIRNAAC